MYLTSAPFWIRILYPKGLKWYYPTQKREVFLTFDDGPIPDITLPLLKILDTYKVKATFFCVGENVQKYPDVFDAITEQGHTIGNHTFHHVKAWKTDFDEYISDVEQCQKLVKSRYFRPPHGQINKKIASCLLKEYQIIMWSALTGDYDKNVSAVQCLANAVKNTRPGAIIVFHDSFKARERMEYSVPLYIEYCLKEGYSFGTFR